MKWWIYVDRTVSKRPYTKEELADRDELNPDTPVCSEGTSEWHPAAEDPRLRELFEDDVSGQLTVPDDLDEISDGTAHQPEQNQSQSTDRRTSEPGESWFESIDWMFVGGFFLVIVVGSVAAVNLPEDTITEPSTKKSRQNGNPGSYQETGSTPGTQARTDYTVTPLFDEEYRKTVSDLFLKADERILVAMYMIESNALSAGRTNPRHDDWVLQLMQDLANARMRGVDVKVILSRPQPDQDKVRTKVNRRSKEWLEDHEITVKYNTSAVEMHDKVVIVDNRWIVQGSHNWTPTGIGENREVSLLLKAKDGEEWNWERYWNALDGQMSLVP